MAWHNRREYPVEQIRGWIAEGKTQQWIGEQLGLKGKNAGKLLHKVCKKHGIKCQRTGPRSGEGHPEWSGGRLSDKSGYILVYSPGHPYARKPRLKYVFEHRLVMEKKLGRFLLPGEVVHHIDGKKDNNSPENLELFRSNGDHLRHELSGKRPKWSPAGISAIRDSAKKRHGIHVKLKPNAWQSK